MPGCRTALLSTVTTASARWPASPGQTSCRSRAPVTSCTDSSPTGMPWPRWPKRCLARRSARWRSPTTARMVSCAGCTALREAHLKKPLRTSVFVFCFFSKRKLGLLLLTSCSYCFFVLIYGRNKDEILLPPVCTEESCRSGTEKCLALQVHRRVIFSSELAPGGTLSWSRSQSEPVLEA